MTPSDLAIFLGTSYGKIKHLYYNNDISGHYETFTIPKKNGSQREIKSPSKKLKHLQERMLPLLDSIYAPRDCVKAFTKKTSIYDNAKPHTSKSFVFNIDLKDFFQTITFPRIRGMLVSPPYEIPIETATVIAHLCTLQGSLPQGAPTSPILSNMICSRLDRELIRLASSKKATYTRYADDITFSFSCPAQFIPNGIVKQSIESSHYYCAPGFELEQIINGNGFFINESKTRLQSRNERQVVTGLTVNKKVNLNRKYIRKTSAIIHSMEVSQGFPQDPILSMKTEKHTYGRLLFIKQIRGEDDEIYRKLAIRFNHSSKICKAPLAKKKSKPKDHNIIYGEAFSMRCWVLESDENIMQATGFMIKGNKLITCAHFLTPGTDTPIDKCTGFLPGSPHIKFEFKVAEMHAVYDIAILDFETKQEYEHPFFELGDSSQLEIGQKISVLGYPNFKASSTQVSRQWAKITNFCTLSTKRLAEIDKNIYSGNSGGPVLNDEQSVIGIAARGADDDTHHNAFILSNHISTMTSSGLSDTKKNIA